MRDFSNQKRKVLLGYGMLIFSPPRLANDSIKRELIFTMKNNKSFSYQRKSQTRSLKHVQEERLFIKNIKMEKRGNWGYACSWKFHQLEPSCFWGFIVPACQIITFAATNHTSGFWMSHSCWPDPSTIVLFLK